MSDTLRAWTRQLRDAVTSVDELAARLRLSPAELEGARRAEAQGLPLRITPYYLSLCDTDDPSCPIRRQVVPHADESKPAAGDLGDPLGEVAHQVAPGLIRRYPDRALLVLTDHCAVYCRFCTRSRVVGGGEGPMSDAALAPALSYLRDHPEVRELIISGGDPLALTTARLTRLLTQVRAIEHVEVIRLATRVPVCMPQRINSELLAALRRYHPLWLLTHFNHPRELTAPARAACEALADNGFPVMNQTVLLRGVNDSAAVLEELFRGLVRMRVKPYYLHQMDPVAGTAHLRTPLQVGIDIMEQLQGRLTGIALPKLIVDTPGGMGKVPVGPSWIVARHGATTTLRTHRGVEVDYIDPPQ